jgi:hypothetical protein
MTPGLGAHIYYSTRSEVSAFFAFYAFLTRLHSTTHLLCQPIMPPRRPLGEINGNRRINHKLTPNQRAEIVGAAKCRVRIADIGRILNFAPLTVRYTYELSEQRDTNVSISRTGRPSIISARVKGTVIGYARYYLKSTYQ